MKNSSRMEKYDVVWRPPSVMWLFLLVCGVFFFMVNVPDLNKYIHIQHRFQGISEKVEVPSLEETMKGFVVKTSGCRIPDMDAMDPSISSFIFEEPPIVCEYNKPPLVDSNLTSLFVVEEAVEFYSRNYSKLECCYKPFWRKEPKFDERDNYEAKMGDGCEPFGSSIDVPHEFVKVICEIDGKEIYKDYFAFVPPKRFTKQSGAKRMLNVVMIGIDAVSRLNFIRQMPKTYGFLKEIKAFEFKGFNKIGDNTYPNLMAALTGRDEGEIRDICRNESTYFDSCPFIWKEFRKKGLVTSYVEDSAQIGSFQYFKKGFRVQPTDYYWLFFDDLVEREIGNTRRTNVQHCVGGRLVHEAIVNYTRRFIDSMEIYNRRYFSFTWSNSISHDFLNKPKLADDFYASTLRDLYLQGSFDHTALFVLSDHGIRWGGIRSTYQGMLEERLPLLMLRLPPWFTAKYPQLTNNLSANTRQLVTPLDIHATLEDLVTPFDIAEKTRGNISRRAYSLFETIPNNRSCESAGIEPHWCTCQESIPISAKDVVVVAAARFTVEQINGELQNYTECARLQIDSIFGARKQTHKKFIKGAHAHEDYTINFRTRPNGALYEVTLRHFYHSKNESRTFEITGTISRLNMYADQSRCISDFRMKLYCFCTEFLK